MLVEPHIPFAASNAHPRLNVLPRRDFPTHRPFPGVAALVPRALTPGYRALAPNGAAQGILSIITGASFSYDPTNDQQPIAKDLIIHSHSSKFQRPYFPPGFCPSGTLSRGANGADRGCKRRRCSIMPMVSERPNLINPIQATKERSVGLDDGTDTLSRRESRHPRCMKLARREREALEKCVVYPDLVPSYI